MTRVVQPRGQPAGKPFVPVFEGDGSSRRRFAGAVAVVLRAYALGSCPGSVPVNREWRVIRARYALRVSRLSKFFERMPGGHRPPTGPLTTAEASEAEDLKSAPAADSPPVDADPETPPPAPAE
jgi:hypothetical protein